MLSDPPPKPLPTCTAGTNAKSTHFVLLWAGMKATPGSNEPCAYAWLWEDRGLADVALDVVFPAVEDARQLPSQAQAPMSKKNKRKNNKAKKAAHDSTASMTDTPEDTEQDSSSTTKRYWLHSQVLSSNSAFFRASLTSAVGLDRRQQDSQDEACTASCRWLLRAEMDLEDAGAVEAVLRFLYTQELGDDTPGSELLRIMQVNSKSFIMRLSSVRASLDVLGCICWSCLHHSIQTDF